MVKMHNYCVVCVRKNKCLRTCPEELFIAPQHRSGRRLGKGICMHLDKPIRSYSCLREVTCLKQEVWLEDLFSAPENDNTHNIKSTQITHENPMGSTLDFVAKIIALDDDNGC